MASLATIRSNVLVFLATSSTDKAFLPASLNFLIQNAVNKIVSDLNDLNPGYLITTATLSAQSATSHLYNLPSDFARVLEVRMTDSDGVELSEVRQDELNSFSGYIYAVYGADHAATLETGPSITAGSALYLKYRAWPADLTGDTDSPDTIPRKFHDVIALEAAQVAFGLGGEQVFPAVLARQLEERTAQLYAHVAKRSVDPLRTRDSASDY